MSTAHERRCCALQAMFQFDLGGSTEQAVVRSAFEARAKERSAHRTGQESLSHESECDFGPDAVEEGLRMAHSAWACREEADRAIQELTPEWSLTRQPNIDRNILRLGYWEIKYAGVPVAVAIDEAVELAKSYSHEKSPSFVNAVLDRIAHGPQAAAE